MNKKIKEEKEINDIIKFMEDEGKHCGEIAGEFLQRVHPKATVFSMYRSAIAFEKDDKDYNIIHIYAVGDPHSMGKELNASTLKEWTNHMTIEGDRFSPILNYSCPDRKKDTINLSGVW